MKIARVLTSAFAYQPSQSSPLTPACLVQLQVGSAVGMSVAHPSLQQTIDALANEVLVGEDARAVAWLWERMQAARAPGGCAAALDIALWDLNAKLRGEPLWRLLGGSRPRVNVHLAASDVDDPATIDRLQHLVRAHRFRAARLDAPTTAIGKRVHAALHTATLAPELMISSTERSPTQLVETVRTLESELDITWVEAPLIADVSALKTISSSVRAAVCAGGELESPQAYLPYLRERAFDIVQIDLHRCGITGGLQIADAAFGFELPVVFRPAIGNVQALVASAMPYCMSMEVVHPIFEGVISSGVRIQDGWAVADDSPGLGLTVRCPS